MVSNSASDSPVLTGRKASRRNLVPLVQCALPSSWLQPIAVLSVAESVLQAGYQPVIIDGGVEDVVTRLRAIDFAEVLCVGISTWSGRQIQQGIQAAQYVRRIAPETPIVWGGIHPSLLPEQTAESQWVDIVVRGEGDVTFPELLSRFESGASYENVKGITFKHNGEIRSTPNRDFIDPNTKGTLPYELLDLRKYSFSRGTLIFPTSRGCPHDCIFCYNQAFNRHRWRPMIASRVLAELEVLVEKFDPKHITFGEDNFFVNRRRVEEICRGIVSRRFQFTWDSTCKADYICRYDKSFLELVKLSGCKSLNIGGESGSPRMLELIRKGITVEQILLSAQKCLDAGIEPVYSFIAGLPTESRSDHEATLDLIARLWQTGASVNGLFVLVSHPGTRAFELAREHGLVIPQSLEEWTDWQPYLRDELGTPWLTPGRRRDIETCADIVRFMYLLRDFGKGRRRTIRDIILHGLFAVAYALYGLSVRLRWRFRFFRYPLEWKLWRWGKKRLLRMEFY